MSEQKQDRWVWILGGILTFLLLCGIVTAGALWAMGSVMRPGASSLEATLQAQWAATRTAQASEATQPEETAPPPTSTPEQSETPVPTPTEVTSTESTPTPLPLTPTPENTPTPSGCTLAAQFLEDVTVPDGTVFKPGETFTKTWRLLNSGTCTWTTAYVAFFFSGDPLGAPNQVHLPYAVPPGRYVDISVPMKAPDNPGEYQGFWKLRSDTGEVFGIGPDANGAFWVQIKVALPTPTPTAAPPTATATPTPTPSPTTSP